MKVLFVASSIKSKYNPFLNAVKKLNDTDVVFFPYHNLYLLDRLLFRLLIHPSIKSYNLEISKIAKKNYYDKIIVIKGSYIYPEVIKNLSKSCNKLIYWSNDDIARKHNRTLFLKKSLKYFDIVYSMKILNLLLDQLQRFKCKKVEYLLQCYSQDLVVNLTNQRNVFDYDVVFVGSYEKERSNSILKIAKAGIKIDVFGNGWEYFSNRYKLGTLNFHKPVLGQQYANVIKASKISLCFLRKINKDSITVRSMEIPAYGGFCLGEYSVEHNYILRNGIDSVWFNDDNDLIIKIKYYLENQNEREKIAMSGNNKIKKWKCTYEDQAKYILES